MKTDTGTAEVPSGPPPPDAARGGDRRWVIHLRPEAPPKPPTGAACNGCGVCCTLEPCPLGMLASLRRRGPCRLLAWDEIGKRYVCGALGQARRAGPWVEHAVRRWIAAGAGCDATVEASPAPE